MRSPEMISLPAPQVERHTLENGLRLLICRKRADPVVAVTIWVRVGYFDEEDHEVGLSHVLEHMYFKGSGGRSGPDGMAREIKGLGGQLNAGTYYDSTHFYVVLPSAGLARALEIQSDALLHPLFDREDLRTEVEAILQEGRRKKDNPGAFALEKAYEIAFRRHRIRRWRMGRESDLRTFVRDDLVAFHKKYYLPGRIVICVAGDVDPREVLSRVEELFSSLPGAPDPTGAGPREPEQRKLRHHRILGDIRAGHIVFLFHTPEFLHPDACRLRVLAVLLGTGRSSRLYRGVREGKRLVNSIGASLETVRDVGLFTLMAETTPRRIGRAAAAILSEIHRVRDGFSPGEMDRARAILERSYYLGQTEVLGLSLSLARFESLGDYRLSQEHFRRLFEVNEEEVTRVAAEYLIDSNCSLLEYLPEDRMVPRFRTPWPVSDRGGKREKGIGSPGGNLSPGIRFSRMESPRSLVSPIQSIVLGSGVRLLLQEDRSLPLASLHFLLPGGKAGEDPGSSGLTLLLQSSMLKGSKRWPGEKLAGEMERLGGSLGREIGDDFFGFSLQTVSGRMPEVMEIFFDLLRQPELSAEEVAHERRNQLAAIQRIRDQAFPAAFRLFRRIAFPGRNYSMPVLGTRGSVSRLDAARVRRWHRRVVRPEGAVIVAVGDINPRLVREAVEGWAEGWAEGTTSRLPRPSASGEIHSRPAGSRGRRILSVRRRRNQTAQIVGFPAPSLRHPDQYPLDILSGITSGLGGRFFEEIRSRRGLAYTVSSMTCPFREGGCFLIYMATSPDKEREARKVLYQEIGRLRQEGPTREEVRRSIRYLQGAHAVGRQTNAAKAEALAEAEVLGLGFRMVEEYPKRIGAVTREEVHGVVRRYLDLSAVRVGVVRGAV